jgi:excisionase family DNA binding protein
MSSNSTRVASGRALARAGDRGRLCRGTRVRGLRTRQIYLRHGYISHGPMGQAMTAPAGQTARPDPAAQILGVHPSTVTRWAADGLLPCVRTPSGERRYRRKDVEELLNQRLKGQPEPMAERAGQNARGRILDDGTTSPVGPDATADPAGGPAPCQRPVTTVAGSRLVPARPQKPK